MDRMYAIEDFILCEGDMSDEGMLKASGNTPVQG
jgi:hypothetical protein